MLKRSGQTPIAIHFEQAYETWENSAWKWEGLVGRGQRGQPYQGPNKLGFGSILTETEVERVEKVTLDQSHGLRHWADFQATCEQLP